VQAHLSATAGPSLPSPPSSIKKKRDRKKERERAREGSSTKKENGKRSGEEKERLLFLSFRTPLFFGRRHPNKRTATKPRMASLPFLSKEEGGGRRRVLGTTLGRACSRGCRERKVRSKIGWLAGSRDSHHVSRFAAFFILARAEISVDGSCFGVSLSLLLVWRAFST
jgi:hypothetical protein